MVKPNDSSMVINCLVVCNICFFPVYLPFSQCKRDNIKKTNVAFKVLHMVTIKGITTKKYIQKISNQTQPKLGLLMYLIINFFAIQVLLIINDLIFMLIVL
jgi:hypothetical protein